MEWTLEMISDHLTFTQLHTPVGTLIAEAHNFPGAVSPENEFFSHPDGAHRFASDLVRIHDNIPLLRNHNTLLGKSSSALIHSWRLSFSLSNLYAFTRFR